MKVSFTQVNRDLVFSTNKLCIWVSSQATERVMTQNLRKLGNIWKFSKLGGDRAWCFLYFYFWHSRNNRSDVCCRKMFLKILQNSLENTCAGVFLIKLHVGGLELYWEKETPTQEFFCVRFKNTLRNTCHLLS